MDYVLVHGTTQAPASWARLSDALSRRGHRVVTVDFPVDQPDYLSADYARVAVEQVGDQVTAPIVVGHSGAGMLLPALGTALGASRLAWLGALIPDFAGGRSLREQLTAEQAAMVGDEWPLWTGDDLSDSVYFLFHSANLETLRWAVTTLRPFLPIAVYSEPAPAKPDIPSLYVVPGEDRTLRPEWMRAAARERLGVTPIDIAGDHCPHIAQPELTAAILTSDAYA